MTKKEAVLIFILTEYEKASKKFPPFNTPHEGYAVILEELDELWEKIKKNEPIFELREEAVQVATMAVRFIIDCCLEKN